MYLCRGKTRCQPFISQECLMVFTCTFSSKDLADGFAFGRSCSALGSTPVCSSLLFHFALLASLWTASSPLFLEQVRTRYLSFFLSQEAWGAAVSMLLFFRSLLEWISLKVHISKCGFYQKSNCSGLSFCSYSSTKKKKKKFRDVCGSCLVSSPLMVSVAWKQKKEQYRLEAVCWIKEDQTILSTKSCCFPPS